MRQEKRFICEGCGAVETARASLPNDWVGYGTSARPYPKKTANWCGSCEASGVMDRRARPNHREATAVAKEGGVWQKLQAFQADPPADPGEGV